MLLMPVSKKRDCAQKKKKPPAKIGSEYKE
jgi:hypothetical protein